MKSFLVKKTFAIRVPYRFLKSEFRDKLTDALYALGANKVKRVGSGTSQMLYISFIEDYRNDAVLQTLIDNELKQYRNHWV